MMVLGHQKSRAPSSILALRKVAGLTSGVGRPSSVQDVPLTPSVIEAPAANVVIVITLDPPPRHGNRTGRGRVLLTPPPPPTPHFPPHPRP